MIILIWREFYQNHFQYPPYEKAIYIFTTQYFDQRFGT
jgi:hypothetical protein